MGNRGGNTLLSSGIRQVAPSTSPGDLGRKLKI